MVNTSKFDSSAVRISYLFKILWTLYWINEKLLGIVNKSVSVFITVTEEAWELIDAGPGFSSISPESNMIVISHVTINTVKKTKSVFLTNITLD